MMSISVITLTPTSPRLALVSPASAGQVVLQIQGQPDVRYVVQTSSNLTSWTSVSTNTLAGNTLNMTNAAPLGSQNFWRAIWQP